MKYTFHLILAETQSEDASEAPSSSKPSVDNMDVDAFLDGGFEAIDAEGSESGDAEDGSGTEESSEQGGDEGVCPRQGMVFFRPTHRRCECPETGTCAKMGAPMVEARSVGSWQYLAWRTLSHILCTRP